MFDEDFKEEEINVPELVEKLKEASHAYYNLSEPVMSDEEFDNLKDLLKKIDPKNRFLFQVGSEVGVTEWKKEKHKIPMGSLNKVNTVEEFKKWVKDLTDSSGHYDFNFVLTPKYDGLSLNCEYENGILKKCILRGQGEEGENVYKNAIKIKNMPLKLKENFTGSLRGEILLHHEDFEKLNDKLKSSDEKEVKNPRNGCALIRRYSGENSEFLSIVFYNCVSETKKFFSLEEELKEIERLGAPVTDYIICDNEGDVIREYNNYEQYKREEFVYDLDGLVIVVNSNEEIENLGEVYGNRKGAIAFKFGRVIKESKVKNIRWDVGKTGKFTPVVEIESVRLLGTDVKSVNIYNMDYFNEYNLGIGDRVKVFKANDIIPKIEEVVERSNKKRCAVLENCPVCKSETEIVGKFLECSNDECQSKYLGNLNKYREVLEIDYISEKTIEKLYDNGLVTYPHDFYTMTKKSFASIDGLGESSYDKVMKQFRSKMEIELPVFIGSLNILQISTKIVEKIYNAGYNTLEKMRNVQIDDLIKIKGLKGKTASKFVEGIKKKKSIIDGLEVVGIKIKTPENVLPTEKKSMKLNFKSFCFTGSLEKNNPSTGENFKRNEVWKIVQENGGTIFDSVKKGLDYLVTPNLNTNSSKAQKARKYGVDVISENEFWEMLN